jgi:hypothetical protein
MLLHMLATGADAAQSASPPPPLSAERGPAPGVACALRIEMLCPCCPQSSSKGEPAQSDLLACNLAAPGGPSPATLLHGLATDDDATRAPLPPPLPPPLSATLHMDGAGNMRGTLRLQLSRQVAATSSALHTAANTAFDTAASTAVSLDVYVQLLVPAALQLWLHTLRLEVDGQARTLFSSFPCELLNTLLFTTHDADETI